MNNLSYLQGLSMGLALSVTFVLGVALAFRIPNLFKRAYRWIRNRRTYHAAEVTIMIDGEKFEGIKDAFIEYSDSGPMRESEDNLEYYDREENQ